MRGNSGHPDEMQGHPSPSGLECGQKNEWEDAGSGKSATNAGAILVSQVTPFAERKGSGHAAADELSLRNAIIKQCSYKYDAGI